MDTIALDGAQGEGGGPDPPHRARAGRGHRAGLPHRPHPRQPSSARPAAPAPRGGPRAGHELRRRGARGVRRVARPALPARRGVGRDYAFDIGTAGAATLVLQAVLPVLATAAGTSRVEVSGGTHVPRSPSHHFLAASLVRGRGPPRAPAAPAARARGVLPARRGAARGRRGPVVAPGHPGPLAARGPRRGPGDRGSELASARGRGATSGRGGASALLGAAPDGDAVGRRRDERGLAGSLPPGRGGVRDGPRGLRSARESGDCERR